MITGKLRASLGTKGPEKGMPPYAVPANVAAHLPEEEQLKSNMPTLETFEYPGDTTKPLQTCFSELRRRARPPYPESLRGPQGVPPAAAPRPTPPPPLRKVPPLSRARRPRRLEAGRRLLVTRPGYRRREQQGEQSPLPTPRPVLPSALQLWRPITCSEQPWPAGRALAVAPAALASEARR
ncbi:classical arabinogalactan protein 9-like [Pteropus medius]|uniref:classical arabinogalactan protein 9-like n=1 Tax=Pteropus vampyrus TaxID=132908 RepID=UPI00196B96AC|nr:classical arabinogalactan protein 9-like [Pteropus giganteus]